MKLFPTIIFSISMLLLIIGIHQIMVNGFSESYWILSFSTGFFLWFAFMKRNEKPGEALLKKYEAVKPKIQSNQTKNKKR